MVLKVLGRSAHSRWRWRKYFHPAVLGAYLCPYVSCLLCLASHHGPRGETERGAAHSSLWQCQCLSTDCSGSLEELDNQHYPCYSLSSFHPTTLAASHSPIMHRALAQNSTELFSMSQPVHQFPEPQLQFHWWTEIPPKSGESQTGSVRGNDRIHCAWAQLLLCRYWGLLTPEPTLALNYRNTSQEFWVASTQSVTSITSYIMNFFCWADLIKLWRNCHETLS